MSSSGGLKKVDTIVMLRKSIQEMSDAKNTLPEKRIIQDNGQEKNIEVRGDSSSTVVSFALLCLMERP